MVVHNTPIWAELIVCTTVLGAFWSTWKVVKMFIFLAEWKERHNCTHPKLVQPGTPYQ